MLGVKTLAVEEEAFLCLTLPVAPAARRPWIVVGHCHSKRARQHLQLTKLPFIINLGLVEGGKDVPPLTVLAMCVYLLTAAARVRQCSHAASSYAAHPSTLAWLLRHNIVSC
jgi:hypothetical protein